MVCQLFLMNQIRVCRVPRSCLCSFQNRRCIRSQGPKSRDCSTLVSSTPCPCCLGCEEEHKGYLILIQTFQTITIQHISHHCQAVLSMHRSAFCQFPFQWIYCFHSNKSTANETEQWLIYLQKADMHGCNKRKPNGLELSPLTK